MKMLTVCTDSKEEWPGDGYALKIHNICLAYLVHRNSGPAGFQRRLPSICVVSQVRHECTRFMAVPATVRGLPVVA